MQSFFTGRLVCDAAVGVFPFASVICRFFFLAILSFFHSVRVSVVAAFASGNERATHQGAFRVFVIAAAVKTEEGVLAHAHDASCSADDRAGFSAENKPHRAFILDHRSAMSC
jgi:hypothetical protein